MWWVEVTSLYLYQFPGIIAVILSVLCDKKADANKKYISQIRKHKNSRLSSCEKLKCDYLGEDGDFEL